MRKTKISEPKAHCRGEGRLHSALFSVRRDEMLEIFMSDELKPRLPLPYVRHMLICEHAEPSQHNPRRANIFGLFSNIVVRDESIRFPCRLGFTVYVALTECRGDGTGRIVVSDPESGDVCYRGAPHRLRFSRNPLEVHAVIFRVSECILPQPGLYWIEFEFDGVVLRQEPIQVVVR